MSRGIGVYADKVIESDEEIIYEYGGYNLNEEKFRNEDSLRDGIITISKSCFTNHNSVSVEYGKMIEDGRITIKNCTNCWHTTDDEKCIDIMALHILAKLFHNYQKDRQIPEHISYNV